MATEDIRIRIRADDQASRKLRDVGTAAAGTSKQAVGMGAALGKLGLALGAVALALKTAQVALRLFSAGMSFAIKEAGKLEAAQVALAFALFKTGQNTKENRDDLEAYAKGLSQLSLATEEQITKNLALNASFGASIELSKRVTQAAIDLASTGLRDQETAFRQVSRTLAGYVGDLTESVPEVVNFTKAQLQAGAAADVISEKYGGSAAVAAKTYEGSVNNLKAAFVALGAEIGGPFTDALTVLINDAIIPAVQSLEQLASKLRVVAQAMAIFIALGLEKHKAGLDFLGLKAARHELEEFQLLLARMFNERDVAGELGPGQLREEFHQITFALVDLNTATNVWVEDGVRGFSMLADELDVAKLGLESFGRELSQIGRGALIAGLNQAIAVLVNSIGQADFSFREFAIAFLKQIAIMIIQALVLRAILGAITGGTSEFAFAGGGAGNFASVAAGAYANRGTGGTGTGASSIPKFSATLPAGTQSQVLGGAGSVVTYNVNAIDSESLTQALVNNPDAVTAGINQAGRVS